MIARKYDPGDRAACLQCFDSNTPYYFLPEERAQLEEFLDSPPGTYFVILDDDDVVASGGFATGSTAGEADIRWTMVRRDQQGHGVGNFVMTTCVAEILANENIHAVKLESSQHIRPFFERWGFKATEVVPNGFGPGLDRVEMRVELTANARAHWQEMITGGLPPPEVERPIPAIESYKEWSANRYNPGHYLGGRLEPHLDQLRTGRRGKRLAGLLIGVSALTATVGLLSMVGEFGRFEIVLSLAWAAVIWIAALRMYAKGGTSDADTR
jgi:predicted GNAT family N-acyltransferase